MYICIYVYMYICIHIRELYIDIHTYVLNAKNVNIVATQSLLVAVNRFFLKKQCPVKIRLACNVDSLNVRC